MTKYICIICNKNLKQKSNYEFHINRKKPCKFIDNIITTNNIIDNIITQENAQITQENAQITQENAQNINNLNCTFCNKNFARKDILTRHVNNYCKKNKIMIKLNKLEEKNEKLEEKINILEQENELLKKQLILSPKRNSSIQNQTNNIIENNIIENNNITHTNNIIINFGDEDMRKLTEDEILKTLKSLSNCFQNFVKIVHLNNRLPEYNNILINNMRSNYGYIITDNKLITKNQNQIIADLITLRVDDLESLSIDYKNKLCSRELFFINDIIDFLRTAYIETEDIDGNVVKGEKTSAKKLKDIYKQLLFMFHDNKDMIKHKMSN
jgi:hypothetical protein